MNRQKITRIQSLVTISILLLLVSTCFFMEGCMSHAIKVTAGKFPEELVYVQSKDDIVNGGVIFTPPKDLAKPIAVIWIHGWGVNFYCPTYVKIGRALAGQDYTCISGNTRMHDIGTVAELHRGKRIRGGGYWGVPSEQVLDIASWIDFAENQGFKKVVLVGHSAGFSAVRRYLAEKQDRRVIGLVSASGNFWPDTTYPDPNMIAQATHLVDEGRGDDLLRFSAQQRSYPSFVSAATFLDIASTPPELKDFFGIIKIQNPAITRIHCPLLAFFATKDDVGTEKDLEKIEFCIQRQPNGPSRVDTIMIQHADPMYTGEENQVAQAIAKWADTLRPVDANKSDTINKHS